MKCTGAPLPARPGQDLGQGLPEPHVRIGDHELYPGKATGSESPQDRELEPVALGGSHVEPHDLPLSRPGHP